MHKSKSYFLINLGEKWTLTNDWSISWHRLVDAGMAGTRKSGVCKELIY